MSNISILKHSKCLSCRSCELSCPKNSIKMNSSLEGFLYPLVDSSCIDCGLCIKVCPALSPIKEKNIEPERYAVILKDKKINSKSSSGGLYGGIASYILQNEGIVFGASYDSELNVEITKIDNVDDLQKIQGSKYVAADTKNTFLDVKKLLARNRVVLYGATPCQIAGLKKFLKKDYENLYTMDLICHGVPSNKLFQKYLSWLGNKYRGKIIYYGFRDKDVSGWSCCGKVIVKTKTKTKILEGMCDPYYYGFLQCENYRESCYSCPYAKNNGRIGDLSMGDFWGTDLTYPYIPSKNGISFLSINTAKGKKLFNLVKDLFDVFEVPESESMIENIAYNRPSVRPTSRDDYYNGLDGDIDAYFKSKQCVSKFKFFLYNKVLKFIPKKLKMFIKKIIGKV
ncbi:MAG: Coenzyme F420 hydrogenase/dehydrogenase, beta subunit C-terminal domain [Clostridia bacterium]|nr:Coenzyme F420 hydrogenase/dehydrogenase, beta subunit C-terminal domain [Clostridia bacterium]MBR6583301.1 Coenzyme F420 hydrogenase/dehydrogenase, beta subunit C-terminal domain [Treponema sp.]